MSSAATGLMETPETVNWPETYYVFVEKVGPFQENAPVAWGAAHGYLAELSQHNTVTRYMSLYKVAQKLYRAGFALEAPPSELPQGLQYELFGGGVYSKFVLTGPYSQLGAATGRVLELIQERQMRLRDDFFIENYVNDPRTTPEMDLVTEILVPTEEPATV